MNHLDRPTALKIVATLTLVLALIEIGVYDLPALISGSTATNQGTDAGANHPYVVLVIGFVVSLAGIVAAYGIWRAQRWGIVLAIIVSGLMALNGLAGALFAAHVLTRIWAATGTTLYVVVIVLCLWHFGKPARWLTTGTDGHR